MVTKSGSVGGKEISTFCPVVFTLGRESFEGLMESANLDQGSFLILANGEGSVLKKRLRSFSANRGAINVQFRDSEGQLSLPARISYTHAEPEGIHASLGLHFLAENPDLKQRFRSFLNQLW